MDAEQIVKDAQIARRDWQPIETAPRDGRDILLCGDPKRYGRPHWIDWWDVANDCWFSCRYSKPPASVIGWMPLPAPP